jgi:protein crumbs
MSKIRTTTKRFTSNFPFPFTGTEIISQSYNGNILTVSVMPDSVVLILSASTSLRVEVRVPARLLDNTWHTLFFDFRLGQLHLKIDNESTLLANSTYNRELINNEVVKNDAAVLILGNAYRGCMLHGPGFEFTGANAPGVVFGSCPLAMGPCQDHDVLIYQPKNYCAIEPCMQHGSCISKENDYECHCTARYGGKNCQIDNGPPCEAHPCLNQGSCAEDVRGNYQCFCPPGYTGSHCETEISVNPLCVNNPCLNNGTCSVPPGAKRYECECVHGFEGARCETDLNDCDSHPCQNNGRCVDGVGAFKCDCTGTGYSGDLCQNNIDECRAGNPCLYNGVCFDSYGSYICDCPPGYGGKNCEQTQSECQSAPCQHGGSCIDQKGRFECICAQGFSGTYCETSAPCPPCPLDSECFGGRCVCKAGTSGLKFKTVYFPFFS